ncbi:MAG: TIGR02099 family protein [Azonexus sp.]|nr:TIGR02099 family protein [Azonexus sp.]
MTDAATRLGLRQALYHRLHWLWPILASSLLRRTLRIALWGALVAWLVFAALVLALRYVVLPNVGMYHERIEQALSQAIGQPVTIGKIEARWQGLNPDLVLDDVAIADRQGKPAFSLEQVETVLSWHSLWRGRVTLALLALERPVLHVRRETSGRITVAGIEAEDEGDPAFAEWVLEQKRIRVRNATIVWEDRLRGAPQLALEDLQFALDNRGRRHRFGLSAAPPSELAARIDVRGEVSGALDEALEHLSGKVFVQLDYADLAAWRSWVDYPVDLSQGRGALRIWGDLENGEGKATADLALEEVRIRLGKKLPELDLSSLRGRLEGRYKAGAWALAGRKVELTAADGLRVTPTDFQVEWQQDATSGRINGAASASFIDLAVIARLAAFLPLDPRSRELLDRHRPQGRIAELRSGWTRAGEALEHYSLRATFADLGMRAGGYFPGADGLAGQVEFNEKGGSLSVDSGRSAISLPAVFPEPDIAFDQLRARASWKVAGDIVDVKLERLQFDGADAAGSASGTYRYTGEGPGVIDLAASIARADGRAVWRYMPRAVSANVGEWLRTSIVAGRGYDGKMVLKGDLADFPFRDPAKGKFLITAKAEGVKLDYATGWPVIDEIKADMSFGVGMRIVAEKGSIFGARLSDVVVEIPDFESFDELLLIRGDASGPTGEFLRFIEQSPVGEKIDHFTREMKASGNGKLDLALDIPLRRVEETRVRGDFRLQNNQIHLFEGMAPLTQVNGRLLLTESSITAPEISGRIFGGPIRIGIKSHADRVAVQVGATSNVGELFQHFGLPAGDRLAGSAAWKSNIDIRHNQTDLVVESDLVGVSSRLPEPLAKAATSPLALRVEKTTGEGGREQYRATLGNVVQAVFVKRAEGLERAVVALGAGDATLPERGVAVRIALPQVDADAWKEVLAANGNGGRNGTKMPALDVVSIRTPVLRLFGRDYTQVDTQLRPRDDGWQIVLSMQEAAGELTWRGAGEGSLEGRMQRLVVRRAAEAGGGPNASLLNSLPALNLAVDDFRIGEMALGRLELRARNDRGAWHLETLNLRNPDGALIGKAVWRNDGAGRHQTSLDFELTASDVGKLLNRLGYVDAIRRGTANLAGNMQWNGPLTGIDYPSLTGEMTVSAENGQFNKLEPGVGRLLGLLSLQSLSRRLTLDFRDIFSEGLAFDSIEGKTVVTAGVMRTAGPLRINSPAAQIQIEGEADLKNETQNLQVLVRPQVGSVAAIGAATLVNPLVGAAALVASTILQNPLGRLFSYRYHVTGSWSDPKVEKVGEFVEEAPPGAAGGGRQ